MDVWLKHKITLPLHVFPSFEKVNPLRDVVAYLMG